MRRRWWIVFSVVVLLVLLSALYIAFFIWPFHAGMGEQAFFGHRAHRGKDIVARVDDENVTRAEFDEALDQTVRRGSSPDPSNEVALRASTLEELILRRLVDRERTRLAIEIPPEQVQAATDRLAREQIGRQFASLDELNRFLQGGGLTFAQFLERTKREIAEDPEAVQRVLLQEKIVATLTGGKPVTEADVTRFFTLLHTSRIMVRAGSQRSVGEARQEAETILKQIRSGADFAKMAREKSEDQATAERDGRMWESERTDWIAYGRLGDPFDTVAFSLKKGEVSDVFTTSRGAYIIRIDDRQVNLPADFLQHKDIYLKRAAEEMKEIRWRNWLRGLRDAAKVTVEDPVIEAYRLESEQDYSAALAKYQQTEKDFPDLKPAILFRVAMIHEAQEKYDEAIQTFNELLALADTPVLRIQYGLVLDEQKRSDEALAQFQKASEMATEDPAIHLTLAGIFLHRLNRPELAEKEERTVAQLVGFEKPEEAGQAAAAQAPSKPEAPAGARKAPAAAPRPAPRAQPRPTPTQKATPAPSRSRPAQPSPPAKGPAGPQPTVGGHEDFPR